MKIKKNSLQSLLLEIARREKNVIEILSVLQDVYQSNQDKISLEWEDLQGNSVNFDIPSIGYIISQINSLKKSYETLTGSNYSKATLKFSDGTSKTISSGSLPVAPKIISGISSPKFFQAKTNKVYNELIDPLTYLKLDLTNKISLDTNKIKVKSLILNLDSDDKVDFFNNNFKTASFSLNETLNKLLTQQIFYDDFVKNYDLPNKSLKGIGTFDVLNFRKEKITENNQEVTRTLYKLDKLSYKDTDTESSVILKVGDKLNLNKTETNTLFEIIYVDASTNEISIKLVEGYQFIEIGTEILSFYSVVSDVIELEIPIKSNQYVIYFLKNINPNLNIESNDWSNGLGIYTNELINFDNNTNEEFLYDFFSTKVKDIAKSIEVISKEKVIPTSELKKLNKPIIPSGNLKVEIINQHKKNADITDTIKKKYSEKQKLDSSLNKINSSIDDYKNKLSTGNFKTSTEKQSLELSLKDIQNQRESLVTEINTKIIEINTKIDENEVFSPKYNIRGFVPIPELKYLDEKLKIGKQEIIGLEVQYRYLTKKNSVRQDTTYTDLKTEDGTNEKASFSQWINLPLKIKEKDVDGNWIKEDLKNPDYISINQISIPVSRGENVEVRVRSLSEVGYPFNLNYSEWSESTIVEFPDELFTDENQVVTKAKDDLILTKIKNELLNLNLLNHASDSLSVNEKEFKHNLNNISTDFLTPENKPISAGDKIKELDTEIKSLKAILNSEKGEISIAITDELGNKLKDVRDADTVRIFSGYYKDLVAPLTIQKGAIISKIYYVELSNISDAELELLGYIPGSYTQRVPDQDLLSVCFDNYDGYFHNKDEYEKYRKYWKVPMTIRGTTMNGDLKMHHQENNVPYIQENTFQSQQTKGQLIYSRDRDLSLNQLLYKSDIGVPTPPNPIPTDRFYMPQFISPNPTQSFIWDGSQTPINGLPSGGGVETDFCVHTLHPSVLDGSEYMSDYANYYGLLDLIPTLPQKSVDNISNVTKIYYPHFIHTKYFDLESNDVDGLVQYEQIPYIRVDSLATYQNFPIKFGFSDEDQYLIGKKTCGSYLSLSPVESKNLTTNSLVYYKGIVIKKGDTNTLRIPIIFQCRMTDFYGAGTSGTGRIGGYDSGKTNLSYAKKIGLDLIIKNQSIFSFDLVVEMQYSASTISKKYSFN